MTDYLILLPPSEGKKPKGEVEIYKDVRNYEDWNYFLSLDKDREYVYYKLMEVISEADAEDLEKIFDVKGKKLQESVEAVSDMLNAETLPAINRFDGVMFKAIDYEGMAEEQKKNFDSHVLFVDGMFGLLKPSDLIPDYKLKISAKYLDVDLTKFWKEKLKSYFEEMMKDKFVIDILPEAHRKVVEFSSAKEHVQIMFAQVKEGKLKNVGHNSKKLKGEIVNYIVGKDKILRKDLEEFSHSEGYSYSEEYSTETLIVYLKD